MLLAEIREQIIRYALGKGIVTDEQEVNYEALDKDIVVAYNKIGSTIIGARRKLSSAWYLSTRVDYDRDIQIAPNSYSMYLVPQAIGGIYAYFRGADGTTGGRIVQTEAEYRSGITNHIPQANRGYILNGVLMVNNPLSRNIALNAPFVNPLELPDFNAEYDNWPMDTDSVLDLISMLGQAFYQYVAQNPLDTKSDSTETTKTINQK